MRGKLIVIEGMDCSGKETQSKLLLKRARQLGIRMEQFSFPNYQSPTGKILGGPLLGKIDVMPTWFQEGPTQVDPKVISLYYAADRLYNIHKINWLLTQGVHVILDRYVYSNMAYQGGNYDTKEERFSMYQWIEHLEFEILNLPRPDIAIFLHVPLDLSCKLKENKPYEDEYEKDFNHLKKAQQAYFELAHLYSFDTIFCSINNKLKSVEEIHREIVCHMNGIFQTS